MEEKQPVARLVIEFDPERGVRMNQEGNFPPPQLLMALELKKTEIIMGLMQQMHAAALEAERRRVTIAAADQTFRVSFGPQ